ncbi:MAG: alcohol dehydrogenase catalytic domain-containing protein [Calditrichaeota bacterium]|nr:alcohol dehydrogenase catalytic domain-containing protein [Calditrichota bacterium]
MHVAMYYDNNDVRLETMPRPEAGPGELVVKVIASGICGSDVLEWYRIKKAPLVLGHEIAGEIIEVGKGVAGYNNGDRVFVSHHVPCNTCQYCLNGNHTVCETLHSTNFIPGGFAEYLLVPEINVDRGTFLLPDEVTYEDAVFIEPLACAIRGQRRANIRIGQTVLIIGSGVSGLLHLMLAKLQGATQIITTDTVRYRLDMAKELGADYVFDAHEDVPERVLEVNNGSGVDFVIICAGVQSVFEQALRSVNQGGTILYYAPTHPEEKVPFSVFEFWNKQVTLTSTYANSPYDAALAIDLIRSGQILFDKMITHRFGLAETGKGFKLMAEAGESMKIIIEPQK